MGPRGGTLDLRLRRLDRQKGSQGALLGKYWVRAGGKKPPARPLCSPFFGRGAVAEDVAEAA